MDTLRDTTSVITGAASGVGRATSISLARRGSRVVVADVDADGIAAVVDRIREDGGSAIGAVSDVTDDDYAEQLRQVTLSEFGDVDIVMNNVGVLTRGLPQNIPVHEWERMFDVNVMSIVRSINTFVPLFLARGTGHIVNTASVAGLYNYSFNRLPYGATKAAVVQMTEGLRLYLEPLGIGVTLLCPGPINTNIAASMPPPFGPDSPPRLMGPGFAPIDPAPVGEMVADAVLANQFLLTTHPEETHAVLVERASDWNGWIVGQTAYVNSDESIAGARA